MAEITEVDPQQAWVILQDDAKAVLIDVRTKMEFDYVGHPTVAIHVPWQEVPGWQVDVDFCVHAEEALVGLSGNAAPKQRRILTLCRSGKRSLAAAEALSQAGFAAVYNIVEGFEGDRDDTKHRSTINGWRFRGLPWEQS